MNRNCSFPAGGGYAFSPGQKALTAIEFDMKTGAVGRIMFAAALFYAEKGENVRGMRKHIC